MAFDPGMPTYDVRDATIRLNEQRCAWECLRFVVDGEHQCVHSHVIERGDRSDVEWLPASPCHSGATNEGKPGISVLEHVPQAHSLYFARQNG